MAMPLPPSLPNLTALANDPNIPHDSKQQDIVTCAIVTWLIGFAFVGLRFYTKAIINGLNLGGSEWCIFAATMCSFATTVCIIMEAQFGMGAHIYDLTPKTFDPIRMGEAGWIAILFYGFTLMLTKLSILLLFVAIFYHSWVRLASYALFVITILSNVWVNYVVFTACIPLQAFWDLTIVGAQCHEQVYFLSNQYLNIATDFLIFFLPIPIVWKLKVKWQQKCLLLFLFAMGFVVCILSLFRIILLTPLLANAGYDATYNTTQVNYWTTVEMNLGIVVACAMTLKPLISRLIPQFNSVRSKSSAAASPGSASRRHLFATFGGTGGGGRRASSTEKGIRVESSFTADFEGKAGDEEMGSVDLGTRRMRQQDPFTFHRPHSSKISETSVYSATK